MQSTYKEPSKLVCCALRSLLLVSVVILEIERGCCVNFASDCRGSSYGSSSCESKCSRLKLSTLTVISRVNSSGVGEG